MTAPYRYGIVGSGWRSQVFARLADRMPDRFSVAGVVTRAAERGAEVEAAWGVPSFRDIDALLATGPLDFVVTSVPNSVTPAVIEALVERGVAVVAETPPAGDVDALRLLWDRVGASGLVQVAEQYPFSPENVARRALVRDGILGIPTWAYVSSTQQYHAAAILRMMLGIGFEPARISAQSFRLPLIDPLSRAGWSENIDPVELTTTFATLDFGGKVGVYDYTDNQVRNPARVNRLVVRGTHGEMVDDRVVRVVAPRAPIESRVTRWQTGQYLNFEVADLFNIGFEGRVLYENPYFGVSLPDEDIAVATVLERTGAWRRGDGDAPYPLAEAAQDQLLALAIAESARTGTIVTTGREAWAH